MLLDRISANLQSFCACAWSTRRLRTSYDGPVLRIRRSSDNAETDFFAGSGTIFTTSTSPPQRIDAWLGNSTGYATKWYDQSGRGNHAVQATQANQPSIVMSSSWCAGGPVLGFNGNSNFMTFDPTGMFSNYYTIVTGTARAANVANNFILGGSATSNALNLYLGYTNANTIDFGNYWQDVHVAYPPYTTKVGHSTVGVKKRTGESYIRADDFSFFAINTQQRAGLASWANCAIGRNITNKYFNGDMSEILMFSLEANDQDLSTLESGVRQYFSGPQIERIAPTGTNPKLALSLRPIDRTLYTGPVIRISNSTGAEADFFSRGNYLFDSSFKTPEVFTGTDLSSGANIVTWYDQSGSGYHGRGGIVGAGPAPKLVRDTTFNEYRVRFAGTSNTSGGYFSCGNTTWNLTTSNGFTAIARVDMKAAPIPYINEQIFDFANGPATNDNISLMRRGNTNLIYFTIANASNSVVRSFDAIRGANVQIFAARVSKLGSSANSSIWAEATYTACTGTSAFFGGNRTLQNSWIGRSNSPADPLAEMDLTDLMLFDGPLADTQIYETYAKIRRFGVNKTASSSSARDG